MRPSSDEDITLRAENPAIDRHAIDDNGLDPGSGLRLRHFGPGVGGLGSGGGGCGLVAAGSGAAIPPGVGGLGSGGGECGLVAAGSGGATLVRRGRGRTRWSRHPWGGGASAAREETLSGWVAVGGGLA
jgi:hypothetical protein